MNDSSFDLLETYDRLIKEGQVFGADNPCGEIELEIRYNCDRNFHKWKWYQGFHIERYYFCELCDTKDRSRQPPSRS